MQVFMFAGYSYMGFSHRWLVSLAKGGDIREPACKAVGCCKSVVESQRVKSHRLSRMASIPPMYFLRTFCAYGEFAKYCI
jgi:hypothetical protein